MKVLIADDHDLVRETIAAFLQKSGGFEIETATSISEAIAKVEKIGRFDVVLLDYDMPGMNGLEGLAKMNTENGERTVAILSGTAPKKIAQEALDAGAIGFVPKTMGAQSLVNAIRFMATGETYVPFSLMQPDAAAPKENPYDLSERELEVLSGLCRGMANKEIARELDLQEVTIKLHVKTLCRKLDAKNRTHAAMIAKENGLV